MLLAEALLERADAQRRLAELKHRVAENAQVQEGEEPAEDPQRLLDEAARVAERIRQLIVAVNVTNAVTRLPDGATVTEALALRDLLGTRVRLLHDAAAQAAQRPQRFARAELRTVPVLDAGVLRRQADRLAVDHRRLDIALQQVNWSTELTVSV